MDYFCFSQSERVGEATLKPHTIKNGRVNLTLIEEDLTLLQLTFGPSLKIVKHTLATELFF